MPKHVSPIVSYRDANGGKWSAPFFVGDSLCIVYELPQTADYGSMVNMSDLRITNNNNPDNVFSFDVIGTASDDICDAVVLSTRYRREVYRIVLNDMLYY